MIGDWTRIDELLGAALDLPPCERDAFLDRVCGAETDLRAKIESLLRAEQRARHFFADPLMHLEPGLESSPPERERLGPYRLERLLGIGGMARVYLARRDDESYERQVAIKVFRPVTELPEVLLRFRRERQILAQLEHPNIARLYEAGTTEAGHPYLVMEYIDGLPLDVYCDRHRLGLDRRLELFDRICSAVHHAHQNLLVHRDLKPTNLLVTAAGEPKLLDFGIAKPLTPENRGDQVDLTRTGLRPMTPGYASPEQIRGEPITTACDVYGLGVVLYELLSGRRPHRATGIPPHRLERAICEEEAEPPSRAVERADEHDPGQSAVAIARSRRLSPRELHRRLQGDLDSIVLKAMRKVPGQRYASAERLAEDLLRFRDGRPVMARKGTFRYRAGKLVRRRWLPLTAAAVILGLVAVFLFTVLAQARRLARERSVAETRRLEAENERQKARYALDFLVDVFRVAEPGESGEVTAREVLAAGAQRISQELGGRPEIQATLLDTIGQAYLSLGLLREASPLLERALTLRRQSLGGQHLEVATSLRSLAELKHLEGDYRTAEKLLREALAIERKRLGVYDPGTVATLDDLSRTLTRLGELDAAERLAREALRIRRGAARHDPLEVADGQEALATVLLRQGKYEEVEHLRREILATRRRLLAPTHPEVAESAANLGLVLEIRGSYDEAARLTREALGIFRRILDPDHPEVATTLQNLGQILQSQGKFEEAESAFREALALRRSRYGERHPLVAVTMNNLGVLLQETGDPEGALALHRQALEIRRATLGEKHPAVANSLCNLGEAYRVAGDLPAAESHYRECLALLRSLGRERHPTISHALNGLARVLLERGEPREALDLSRRALSIRRDAFPSQHWRIAESEGCVGACLTALGRFAEAEPLLLASYRALDARFGTDDRRLRLAASRVARLYEAWGRPQQAARYR
jgi:serine/threonine protein kinase/tetratricopeptide (TPR) repeat protein